MKSYISRDLSGIDSLEVQDIPAPGPLGPGGVRIAMRAASVNYRDTMAVSGAFGPAGPDGLIPCSDGAGEVLEVAPDVNNTKVGDRVALTFNPDWIGGPWQGSTANMGRGSVMVPGVMQEEVSVHHSEIVRLPEHLDYEEGAALPCAGVTAWNAICGPSSLLPGMSVLLEGAGGVAVLGLQLAKLFGARVIMTTSSEDRAQRLKALGADDVINYRENPDWHNRVRELTGGIGVDVGVDIGGAETLDKTIASTRPGGRLALVGLLTGWPESTSKLFSTGLNFHSIKVGSRYDFEMMNRAIGYHQLRPVIDSQFAFDQLKEVLSRLKSGKHFGKIVIRF